MTVTLDEALALTASCRDAARAEGMRIIAVVVDPGGHTVALIRMDGAIAGGVEAATAKARAAVLYQRPTSAYAAGYREGRPLHCLPGAIPLGGGIPLMRGGRMIGALGVSGAVEKAETELAERVVAEWAAQGDS